MIWSGRRDFCRPTTPRTSSDVAFTILVLGARACGLAEMLDQTNDGIGA